MHVRAGLVVAVLVVVLGWAGGASASAATVSFQCCSYTPGSVRIAPGEQVTWDGAFGAHPLRSREGETLEAWDTVGSGSTFSHQYTNVGVWHYYCAVHGSPDGTQMSGEVTVTANHPPSAVITGPATAAAGQQVTFDASGSSDPDPGQTLAYRWDLDGDGAFDDGTAPEVQRTYATARELTVRVRVTDSNADAIGPEQAVAVHAITIEAAPATVAFGGTHGDAYVPADVRITPGKAVAWTGVLADHPLASATGAWAQQDTGTLFAHVFDDPGRFAYYCALHGAADGTGMAGTITVTANRPPVASFTAPAAAPPGDAVTFDASAAHDPDAGQTLSYDWDLDGDGTFEATGKTPSTTYDSARTVDVTLRVTDSNADAVGPEQATTTRGITIRPAPAATIRFPDAAGGNAYSPRDVRIVPGATVSWTGPFGLHPLASDEARWATRNGSNQADGSFFERFDQAGRFRFHCVFHGAAGGAGMSGTVTVTANEPPVAAFAAPAAARSGEAVSFDAAASTDDRGIAAYAWDLDGNGTFEAAGRIVTRSYAGPAAVTVRLWVTDDNADAVGAESATATQTVIVSAPPDDDGRPPPGEAPPGPPPATGDGPRDGGSGVPRADTVKPRVTVRPGVADPLRVRIRSSEAGRVAIRLRAGQRTLATRTLRFAAAAERVVTLRLTRAAAARLRAARRLRARLTVVVTDAAGNARTVTKTVTLRR